MSAANEKSYEKIVYATEMQTNFDHNESRSPSRFSGTIAQPPPPPLSNMAFSQGDPLAFSSGNPMLHQDQVPQNQGQGNGIWHDKFGQVPLYFHIYMKLISNKN
jgi:hypothetical protein